MSCHRYQVDLSQCLDGRLPGARRATVLAHVDQCAECAIVWAEMQAAQSLVFGLPEQRVSQGFRENVWNRIHSGEGSPEILLQEPVSFMTKIRYGVVGAAAAAVVMLGTYLLVRDEARAPELPHGTDIADRGTDIPDENQADGQGTAEEVFRPSPDRPAPRESQSPDEVGGQGFATPTALTAGHLAFQTVKKVSDAAKRLHLRRRVILEGSFEKDRTLHDEVVTDVKTIENGLTLINYWQNRRLVQLEPASVACITVAEHTLHNFRSDSKQRAMVLVKGLDSCSLNALENDCRVTFRPQELELPQQIEMIREMVSNDRYREIMMSLDLFKGTGINFDIQGESHFWTGTFFPRGGRKMIQLRIVQPGAAPAQSSPRRESAAEPQTKKGLIRRNR